MPQVGYQKVGSGQWNIMRLGLHSDQWDIRSWGVAGISEGEIWPVVYYDAGSGQCFIRMWGLAS